MAIKVVLGATENTQQEKPFPKLMISQYGDVFYMVRDRYGLPLTDGDWAFDRGNFADFSGTTHKFTDYNEPIIIQNR